MGRLVLGAVALLAVALTSHAAAARDIAVVAGDSFPARALTREDVRDIYLGEKVLLRGDRLRAVTVREPGDLQRAFLRTLLGVSDEGFQAYWIRKVFQDGGTPPSSAGSADTALQMVRADRAALAYVWADDAEKASGVRILLKVSSRP